MTRWNRAIADAPFSAGRLVEIARQLKPNVAPCVIASLQHSWFNGWCTARRLKASCSCCVFGCPDYVDELEHYLICPRLWDCAFAVLRLDRDQRRSSRSLLVAPLASDSLARLALHNYAAHGTYTWFKHNVVDIGMLLQVYRERIRKAAVLHKKTAKILRDLFQQ